MKENCKLCKKEKELKNSHVIPKLLYRYMRRYQDRTKNLNGLLVLNTKKGKVDVTQRQWKEKLFCENCEEILSKNETKFARILHEINNFSKNEVSEIAYSTDFKKISEEALKLNPNISLDDLKKVMDSGYLDEEKVETLKYFSASCVLRQLYIIDNSLGKSEVTKLERYLLGQGDGEFNLVVDINTGDNFKAFCSSIPLDNVNDFKHYNFIVPEMWFHLIFDTNKELGDFSVIVKSNNFFENRYIIESLKELYKDAGKTKKAQKAFEE